MKFNFSNDDEKKRAILYFKKLLNTDSVIEITKRHQNRTINQNAYLHLLLSYSAQQIGESLYYFKQVIWKQLIAPEIFRSTYTNPITGVERVEWKSSSDLDTKEMISAIEKLKDWASKEIGLTLPDATDQVRLDIMEKEIKYK